MEIRVGDRVTVNPFLTWGKCINCLLGNSQICSSRRVVGIHTGGGLAEFLKVPQKNLAGLPESIPFDQGGIIVDAVAAPFHAIMNLPVSISRPAGNTFCIVIEID